VEASALQAPLAVGRIGFNAALLRLRSDDQLVALFRAGNDEAYRVIHDRYRQRLFSYMRQMLAGSRPDAEDALQDVFLRAYSSLRADDRPIALRAWLYRVAHNRCIDQLRRPVPDSADVYDVSRSPLPDPLEETERREDLRRLVADVRRLPEPQRSALLMRELEGLSYAELAAAQDISIPAVKSLLVRARLGLVQAAEARDTTCNEIRADLALAHGRGVRANGRARRHLRDCNGCRDYRQGLRHMQRSFGALAPAGGTGTGLLAKLGLGGSGSAAAGGGAASGTGLIGGGAATVTAGKLCAVVCSVALTAGGAVEVQREISDTGARSVGAPAPQVRSLPDTPQTPRPPGAGLTPSARAAGTDTVKAPAKAKAPTATAAPTAQETPVATQPDTTAAPTDAAAGGTASTGGAQAPADLATDNQTAGSGATDKPKATGAAGDATATPVVPLTSAERPAEKPAPPSGSGAGAPPHP
jgi:RNA polymerase sigma factor (sigma-70 family)